MQPGRGWVWSLPVFGKCERGRGATDKSGRNFYIAVTSIAHRNFSL